MGEDKLILHAATHAHSTSAQDDFEVLGGAYLDCVEATLTHSARMVGRAMDVSGAIDVGQSIDRDDHDKLEKVLADDNPEIDDAADS